MKKYNRTKVYKQKRQPKYMFKWIANIIRSRNKNPQSLLDIGAASGDFLDYASSCFVDCKLIGVEYDKTLVETGREAQGLSYNLQHGDAENLNFCDDMFDVVVMTGTHSIFDDFQLCFNEALRVTKEDGLILITGIFNDHPVDAQIYWKYPNQNSKDWNRGYNYWSKDTISGFLIASSFQNSHEFIKFELPFDLDKNDDDPIRSWTEYSESGKKILVNGIMPLNFQCLVIKKKNLGY